MIAAAGFTGEVGRSTQASPARQERGQLEAVLLPVQPRPFQTKPHLELQGDDLHIRLAIFVTWLVKLHFVWVNKSH